MFACLSRKKTSTHRCPWGHCTLNPERPLTHCTIQTVRVALSGARGFCFPIVSRPFSQKPIQADRSRRRIAKQLFSTVYRTISTNEFQREEKKRAKDCRKRNFCSMGRLKRRASSDQTHQAVAKFPKTLFDDRERKERGKKKETRDRGTLSGPLAFSAPVYRV